MSEENEKMIKKELGNLSLMLFAMGVHVVAAEDRLIFYKDVKDDGEPYAGFSVRVNDLNLG